VRKEVSLFSFTLLPNENKNISLQLLGVSGKVLFCTSVPCVWIGMKKLNVNGVSGPRIDSASSSEQHWQ